MKAGHMATRVHQICWMGCQPPPGLLKLRLEVHTIAVGWRIAQPQQVINCPHNHNMSSTNVNVK